MQKINSLLMMLAIGVTGLLILNISVIMDKDFNNL